MAYPIFYVPAGDVLPILFASYDKDDGSSITLTGLAVTDIEIYKDGSVTQRASDAGFTLLDTDGIDFDGITGIHGFSIDTGDNTDSGFYTVGSWFHVVVSAVTIDAVAVSFIAAAFRIMKAESIAGVPKADVDAWLGTAAATPTVAGVPEVDLTHVAGATTNVAALATNVDAILTDTADMQPKLGTPTDLGGSGATLAGGLADIYPIVDSVWDDSTAIAAAIGTPSDLGGGATVAANLADIESQTDDIGVAGAGLTVLATQASVNTIDDILDTEFPALITAVADLPTNAELATALGTADDAVLAAIAALNNLSASAAATAVLTTQMTEAYAADGAAPTLAQALHLMIALLSEFAISGTTLTAKKLDGSTTAATFTLDSATTPTSITRAT